MKTNWKSIAVYYVLAVALIVPFRIESLRPGWFELLPTIAKAILSGYGPAVGAIVAMVVFRRDHLRTITVAGRSLLFSGLFFFIPILFIAGLGNRGSGIGSHLGSLYVGFTLLVYCFLEEVGWRGFLYDALRHVGPWRRVLITAVLWYLWHLSLFDFEPSTSFLLSQGVFVAMLTLGSWFIGKLADDTRSILVAAGAHSLFNIFSYLQVDTARKLLIGGGCIACWVVLARLMPAQRSQSHVAHFAD